MSAFVWESESEREHARNRAGHPQRLPASVLLASGIIAYKSFAVKQLGVGWRRGHVFVGGSKAT